MPMYFILLYQIITKYEPPTFADRRQPGWQEAIWLAGGKPTLPAYGIIPYHKRPNDSRHAYRRSSGCSITATEFPPYERDGLIGENTQRHKWSSCSIMETNRNSKRPGRNHKSKHLVHCGTSVTASRNKKWFV